MPATSVFANLQEEAFPFRYAGQLTVTQLVGGTPADPNVAEGWLKTKWAAPDELIQQEIATLMVERGLTKEQATEEANLNRHLTGFRRDDNGLFLRGAQVKAALKEAASCAVASNKLEGAGWGKTNKGLLNYLAEHVFVIEEKIYIRDEHGNIVQKPTDTMQNFVHTFRGNGIKIEEFVLDGVLDFTVWTDHPFTWEQWGLIWTLGEFQGVGASRSQGYGRYMVTRWDPIEVAAKPSWPATKSRPVGMSLVAKATTGRKSKATANDEATEVQE